MATNESFVQVNPDGSGKRIRNLKLTLLQPDGTYADVYVQAISVVDTDGFAVDMNQQNTQMLLKSILAELQSLRRIQGRATGQHWAALPDGMSDQDVA